MRRFLARSVPVAKGLVWVLVVAVLVVACSSSSNGPPAAAASKTDAGASAQVASAVAALGKGDWSGALTSSLAAEKADASDCGGQYCELIARAMMVVDEINTFLLPRYRRPLTPMPGDQQNLDKTNMLLDAAIKSAENVATRQCEFDLPKMPFVMGDVEEPIMNGEIRGRWTTRDAHMMAALFDSISYGLQA